jgi:hypothetical protein
MRGIENQMESMSSLMSKSFVVTNFEIEIKPADPQTDLLPFVTVLRKPLLCAASYIKACDSKLSSESTAVYDY